MIPSRGKQHLDEHFLNQIPWKRQKNTTYKWIFAFLEIEMLKTSLPAVKRIGQRSVTKATLNKKVGFACTIASTINNDHGLKMIVLMGIRKRLLSIAKINSFPRLTQ